ncbi:MAG: 3-dehydroquinate synthase, partial [Patescibacteria group bacterium]
EPDFKIGLAEVIKHGIIAVKNFFNFLKKNADKILKREKILLKQVVEKSANIKLRIVRRDEKESLSKAKSSMSRMLLNYGHTVGHALEQLSDYTLPHGEAVAIGMVAENRVAVGRKILKQQDAQMIIEVLKMFGLPTKIPSKYAPAQIKKALGMDKKHIGGKLHFALPTKIGQAKVVTL